MRQGASSGQPGQVPRGNPGSPGEEATFLIGVAKTNIQLHFSHMRIGEVRKPSLPETYALIVM